MRRVIKKPTEFNTPNLDEYFVSDEIVNSGNYNDAQKILQKNFATVKSLAEQFYRLGNRFFNVNQIHAAEMSWEKAGNLSGKTKYFKSSEPVFTNLKRLRIYTILSILTLALCLYGIIFTLFEREPEIFQFTTFRSYAGKLSFWDEWWNTGRPVKYSLSRNLGSKELWPLLKQKFNNIFEREKKVPVDEIKKKLKRWLEIARSPHLRDGPTDYYALTARGLFEAREYDEALSTLKEGFYYAESTEQVEQLYQDLGTVHYYKGYNLQPDGLAQYDLKDVLNSIESYENALRYGEDPYLYGNLGWGYYLLGDYNSSVENSLKALAMNPELNYARMNLGIAYIKKGDYLSAYDAYDSLMKYSTNNDEYEGGIRDLKELQKEFPGVYPFSNFVLAQLYKQQHRYMEANESFQRFIRQNFHVEYWLHKARGLLREMKSE